MKRYLSTLMLMLFSAGILTAQEKTAKAVFDTYTHDFGKIDETDGDVSYTFRFKNEGTLPFVIHGVNVSCGCTNPVFSREPVLPGKSGQIKVTFDPTNRPGLFEKTIDILCNDARKNIRLTITGNVNPRPRTIQDDFPFHVRDGLRITERSQVLGSVPRGKKYVYTIGVANGGQKPVTVALDRSAIPSFITAQPRKNTLQPGERSEIVFTFDTPAKDGLWGKETYRFPLLVNGTKVPDEIILTPTFTEDFSGMSAERQRSAPRAEYSSFFYHFSDQKPGKTLKTEFQITNDGKDDLIIRYLGPMSRRVKATADKMVIKSGDTATVSVTLDTADARGRLSDGVTVVTNDPSRPARDFRVMANVVN